MADREYFAHDTALVTSERIGKGTRIWAFCNVQRDAVVGEDCNICDHCFVENNAVIGDRVTIKNGVSIWDGVVLENDVFVGPNAVFTNDVHPRSKVYHDDVDRTLVRLGATVGANAVVVAGHTIGRYAFIGAGAVVTRDVPDFSLWLGNPARMAGYVCKCARRLNLEPAGRGKSEVRCRCVCGLKYRLDDGHLVCEE